MKFWAKVKLNGDKKVKVLEFLKELQEIVMLESEIGSHNDFTE